MKKLFLLTLSVLLVCLLVNNVYALSEGPKSASGFVSESFSGSDYVWLNPNNAGASDNLRASVILHNPFGQFSDYLGVIGYNFNIPDVEGVVINGIEVRVEKSVVCTDSIIQCGAGTYDNKVRIVKNGIIGTTDKSSLEAWTDTDSIVIYGGPNDLWGESWSVSDINSLNTGFVISAKRIDFGQRDARVDHITMTVYYTDIIAPEISLLGENEIIIEAGDSYNDLGATALDNVDGVLTDNIITFNEVDTHTVGTYVITYDVVDSSGNEATQVTRIVNVVDTIPPIINERSPGLNEVLNNDDLFIRVMMEDSGSRINHESISVKLDGGSINLDIDDNINRVEVTSNGLVSIDEGEHELLIEASDIAGNSISEITPFFIDLTNPEIDILNPPSGDLVIADVTDNELLSLDISAHLDDQFSGINPETIVMKVDGEEVEVNINEVDFFEVRTTLELDDGLHTVELYVEDRAGNSAKKGWSFTVDKSFDAFTDLIINEVNEISNVNFNVDVGGERPSELLLIVDDEEEVLCNDCINFEGSVNLKDGTHTITVLATDAFGRSDGVSTEVVVDTLVPLIKKVNPKPRTKLGLNNILSVAYIEKQLESISLFYRINNGEVKEKVLEDCEAGNNKLCSISLTDLELEDGILKVNFVVRDRLREIRSNELIFYIDVTAPTITLNSPTELVIGGVLIDVDVNEVSTLSYSTDGNKFKVLCRNCNHVSKLKNIGDASQLIIKAEDKSKNIKQINAFEEIR